MNLKLNILIIFIWTFYGFSQNKNVLNLNDDCSESNIFLKTEKRERFKNILFFKTKLKKYKTIDRILDHNSNMILESVTKFIGSGDSWEIKYFNRIKIDNKKIIEYSYTNNSNYGKITFYNKCGILIKEKRVSKDQIRRGYSNKN